MAKRTLHYDMVNNNIIKGPVPICTRLLGNATRRNSSGLLEVMAANTIRHEHDKNGNRRGWLIEEPQTNYLRSTDTFAVAGAWGPSAAMVVQPAAAIGPDGTMSMERLIDDNRGGTVTLDCGIFVSNGLTSTKYFADCWFMKDGCNFGWIQTFGWTTPADGESFFDLENGVVGTKHAGHSDSGMEDWGGGLWRCWIEFTNDATDSNGFIRVGPSEADASRSVPGDGTSSIFAYGGNLQASDALRSFIDNPSASVDALRGGDIISTADGSWRAADGGGTFYAKGVQEVIDTSDTNAMFSVQLGGLGADWSSSWNLMSFLAKELYNFSALS